MGTWGPGIFSDDLALDVRDVWREALMDGLDDAAATARVLEERAKVFDDEHEAVVGWPALAAAQHQTGRLIRRPDAADHRRSQAHGFADGPAISGSDSETLAAFQGRPWDQGLVEATRRLYGL